MLDAILRLSVSIHGGKGIYAILLGSGVSRSSAIPTGWEIVIDLIRKLAHVKGENCDSAPEEWYKKLTGNKPDYSDVLDQLTSSSTERAQLLRSYFEPTLEEREQGRKLPSSAHRAIAMLVVKGYFKVIVTTNFDRLMEQALTEAGVHPTVISTSDSIQGALPLTHSACTIIKLHGDYLDSRLKNTALELAAYDKPLDQLLDRVFDEYGLIVCGWSAEWDVALRAALERCPNHRFGTYWTSHRGELAGEAKKLISIRKAAVIPVVDADSFFHGLSENISGLENFTLTDPISARVAVARMKRYLGSPDQRINLYDLVNAETERVYAATASEPFLQSSEITPAATLQCLRTYEGEMHILLPLLACGSHWAAERQYRILCRSLKRLADGRSSHFQGFNIGRYSAMLAMYTIGVAAIAGENYGLLKQALELKIRTDNYNLEKPITELLSPLKVIQPDFQKQLLPGRERQHTPLNNHVFEALRDVIREYLPEDKAYEEAFDWFEYLVGLVHCDLNAAPDAIAIEAGSNTYFWGPIGRFLWSQQPEDNILTRTRFESNGPYPRFITTALQGGLFGSSGNHLGYVRFRTIKSGFDALVNRTRQQKGIW